ncbi:MAG: hypothetical protein WC724_01595 [Candidatus Paceibacterota bacterium]|jgi:hypothetical protein
MKTIFETYKGSGNLHHAYLIEGETTLVPELVSEIEKAFGLVSQANPDFFIAHYETLGIDEGRELKRKQSEKSLGGDYKIFVVSALSFTREAQNSLLKVFEEPTAGTHFFIVLKDARAILPTLRSRMVVVLGGETLDEAGEIQEIANEFLKKEPTERLQMPFIKKLIADKDRERTSLFMDALQEVLSKKINGKTTPEEVATLETVIKFRGYLRDRSPSIKMIVEYLAITL